MVTSMRCTIGGCGLLALGCLAVVLRSMNQQPSTLLSVIVPQFAALSHVSVPAAQNPRFRRAEQLGQVARTQEMRRWLEVPDDIGESGVDWGKMDCFRHPPAPAWESRALGCPRPGGCGARTVPPVYGSKVEECGDHADKCVDLFKGCLLSHHKASQSATAADCFCYSDVINAGCTPECSDAIFKDYGEMNRRCWGFDSYQGCKYIDSFHLPDEQWFGLRSEPAVLRSGPHAMLEEVEGPLEPMEPMEVTEPETAKEFSPIFGRHYGLDPDTDEVHPMPMKAAPPVEHFAPLEPHEGPEPLEGFLGPEGEEPMHPLEPIEGTLGPEGDLPPLEPLEPLEGGLPDGEAPVEEIPEGIDEVGDVDPTEESDLVPLSQQQPAYMSEVPILVGDADPELQFRQPAGTYVQNDESATLIFPWAYKSNSFDPRIEQPYDDDDPRE